MQADKLYAALFAGYCISASQVAPDVDIWDVVDTMAQNGYVVRVSRDQSYPGDTLISAAPRPLPSGHRPA